MTETTAPLTTEPSHLADILVRIPAGTDVYTPLIAQVGERAAQRLLADAHSIAAKRLWAAAHAESPKVVAR